MDHTGNVKKFFGVENVLTLSPELYDNGIRKLLVALREAADAEEEISLWITANDIKGAPSPEKLRFAEARVYARMILSVEKRKES